MHTIYGRRHKDHGNHPSRRLLLASSGAIAVAGCAHTQSGLPPHPMDTRIGSDLETYVGFGPKHAGGAGDNACGAWIEHELAAAGCATERHALSALHIEQGEASMSIGEAQAPVAIHAIGPARSAGVLEGMLTLWGAHAPNTAPSGAIVVAHLPTQRWSSAEQPTIRRLIARAGDAGAAALVLVTHGPTRGCIKLNRTLAASPLPIVLMSPSLWESQFAQSAGRARLQLNAYEREISAFNVVGRIDRGAPSTIVVSTPRSGWTACAGERGPGIAAFLALARSAPGAFPRHNLLFLCNSAHEFENAGAAVAIQHVAPAPSATALWLHLGAGFAARDWHESGAQLAPLPSADPQRFLIASPHLLSAAQEEFAGLAGLEAPYSSARGAGGELSNIIAQGYPNIIGMLGAHRFHHVDGDDMTCLEPNHVALVIERVQRLMQRALT